MKKGQIVEGIVSEGFKMGKGTKIGLTTLVAGLAAYGVYKTVKFFGKKKESEEIDDVSAEYDTPPGVQLLCLVYIYCLVYQGYISYPRILYVIRS